jgi:hypothetical protein
LAARIDVASSWEAVVKRTAHAAPVMLLVLLGSLSVATTQADDFSEFVIPPHRVSGWDGTLFAAGRRDARSSGGDRFSLRDLRGEAGSNLFWHSESDSRFTGLEVSAFAGGSRMHARTTTHNLVGPFDDVQDGEAQQTDRDAHERWNANLMWREYPWAVPIGVELSITGRGTYGASWRPNDNLSRFTDSVQTLQTLQQINSEDRNQSQLVFGEIRLGIGKVRDETGVYEALVIEERLRERGVVRARLSASTRRRIAELLYVRYDVLSAVERPARRLWDQLESVLREDDAVDVDRMDAASIQRVGEALFDDRTSGDGLPSSPLLRRRGFFVGPALTGGHTRSRAWSEFEQFYQVMIDDSVVTEFRSRTQTDSDDQRQVVWAGPTGEWHHPWGPRVQVDVQSRLMFNLRETDDEEFETGSYLSLGAILADRWLGSISASHERWTGSSGLLGPNEGRGWRVSFGGSVRYFIEDHLSLELAALEVQQDIDRPPVSPFDPARMFNRSGNVRLGVRYRFMGRLDAPGVLPSIRI